MEDVNEWEPRFRHPQYEFEVEAAGGGVEAAGGLRVGRLVAHDGDAGTLALSLAGQHARYVGQHTDLVAADGNFRPFFS